MNKKAFYAILIAVALPLLGYFIIKRYGENAITMPPHFYVDTIIPKTVKGKITHDTVWQKLPDFSLVNQQGDSVSWDQLKGKVVVADFFFTHCPTICPRLTTNMRWLQQSINNSKRVGDKTPDFLHFLSFSIDPERDSVPRLKQWADRFQVNPGQWWLLTGNKKEIYDLAINDMKIGVVDGQGVDTSFIHTDHFVLIDSNRHVRGYYHGLDTTSLQQLSNDIIFLNMEKDPNRGFFLSDKLSLMAVVFLLVVLGLAVLFYFLRKKDQYADSGTEKK